MNFAEHFTQGGQTQLHKLRMLRQVLVSTILISLGVGVTCFAILTLNQHSWHDIVSTLCYYWCKLRPNLPELPDEFLNSVYLFEQQVSCRTALYHPEYSQWFAFMVVSLRQKFFQSLGATVISMIMVSSFWIWRGRQRKQPQTIKGATLSTPYQLRNLVRQAGCSDISFAHVPLPKGSECEHVLFTGTTGTGKSNAIHHLLQQIRHLNQKAIIVDATGELVARFYDKNRDKILNPLDPRSEAWGLWDECKESTDFDELAANLIVQNSQEQFWSQTSRQLFATVALKLGQQGMTSLTTMLELLLRRPLKETAKFLEGTEVGSYVALESEKTSLSIRATLASNIKCLSLLENREGNFAIKEWVAKEDLNSWLFIAAHPTQRESLKPLLSAWLSIAVTSVLGLSPDPNRRIWFIIDELSALHKLPILLPALAETRKYGGCFALGFQDLSQLDEIYGIHATRSLCSLINTKLIFRANDNAIARRLSELLGEEEIIETTESISFVAHQMRDGVSLADQRRAKPLVSPSDIMQLNKLESYLKLAGNFPVAKVKFTYLVKTQLKTSHMKITTENC